LRHRIRLLLVKFEFAPLVIPATETLGIQGDHPPWIPRVTFPRVKPGVTVGFAAARE
jgi:hypothetical protein